MTSSPDTQPSTSRSSRETWTGQGLFLLAAIGSAIGLGNIWRFPGVAYTNGGGAFMVPYLIALIVVGIPVLLLDYAIGHKFRGSPPLALRRFTRRSPRVGEFLGWFQVAVCLVIFLYYAVVIAWACRYAVYSVTEAWGADTLDFFLNKYLQTAEAGTFSLTPVLGVMIPLALVWVLVVFIMARGLAGGIELANKVFLPLLVVLFTVMVVRALFLPGALDGLNALFTPNWDTLTDTNVWLAAFAQIFYSMSIAFGIMLTYSSYLKPRSNLVGTGLVAGFANSSFEVLAGIGVFSALGFMAHGTGVGVNELTGITGPILSFVTFPQIISMMPGGPLFGCLFFTSLVLAGFTSLLSLLQVVSGGLQDKFGFNPRNAALVMGIPAAVISILLFGTRSGLDALDVMDNFINGVGVVGSAIAMTVVAAVLWKKLNKLRHHLNTVSSVKVPKVWNYIVGLVVPAVLTVMLTGSIIQLIKEPYGGHSQGYLLIFGWGSVIFALLFSLVMTMLPWKDSPEAVEMMSGPPAHARVQRGPQRPQVSARPAADVNADPSLAKGAQG